MFCHSLPSPQVKQKYNAGQNLWQKVTKYVFQSKIITMFVDCIVAVGCLSLHKNCPHLSFHRTAANIDAKREVRRK